MGRWSQRNLRGGGGPRGPNVGVVVLSVTVDTGNPSADVNFSGPVDVAQWSLSALQINPGGDGFSQSVGVHQVDELTLQFSGDAHWADAQDGDPWKILSGPPGFTVPQSGTIGT